MKSKKGTKESKISQKKVIIIIAVLTIIIVIGYLQKPTEEDTEEEPTTPVEEPTEPEQICTEMWICQNENTKAYRKSDCTFEQVTDCPAGCENGECKEVIDEEPEIKEDPKEEPKETEEKCTIGFKCLDEKRRGYQSSNCMFNQVDQCDYGCKDGECIKEAPPEEEKEETFTLTEGKGTMNKTGWKFSDFDKNEIFLEEVYDYDFKLKLYASASGYDYFRAESSRDKLWIIDKGIEEATRADCMEDTSGENSYGYLRTDQTLCLETREKDIALIGGYWEGLPKEDTELIWKYYT